MTVARIPNLKPQMPERLRRLERHFQRLPIYFITACTHQRLEVLNNADIHARLIQFGNEGPEHGAWLGAYVLMPDHLHAFVAVDDQRLNLSTWVKSLKNVLSKVLRVRKVSSPHWQKGFFDHILRSSESYSQKWYYVRDNPVRANLVKEWRDWPFLGEVCDLELRDDRY
jgi:REP-associated tyrosine transposase